MISVNAPYRSATIPVLTCDIGECSTCSHAPAPSTIMAEYRKVIWLQPLSGRVRHTFITATCWVEPARLADAVVKPIESDKDAMRSS